MKTRHITLFTAIAAAAAFASTAQAQVTLSDGHTGDYRIIFTTDGTTLAQATTNVGPTGFYNVFVTTQAAADTNLNALGTTWTAVASTKNTSAAVNTGTTGPGTGIHIYTPTTTPGSYQLVATSYDALWNAASVDLLAIINFGDGSMLPATQFPDTSNLNPAQTWTGTNADGSSRAAGADGSYLGSGPNGDNTASNMHLVRGGYTDKNWIEGVSRGDHAPQSYMGMSGVIPEPSSLSLLALGGLALLRRRRS